MKVLIGKVPSLVSQHRCNDGVKKVNEGSKKEKNETRNYGPIVRTQ